MARKLTTTLEGFYTAGRRVKFSGEHRTTRRRDDVCSYDDDGLSCTERGTHAASAVPVGRPFMFGGNIMSSVSGGGGGGGDDENECVATRAFRNSARLLDDSPAATFRTVVETARLNARAERRPRAFM